MWLTVLSCLAVRACALWVRRMAKGARVLMFSATYDVAQNRDAVSYAAIHCLHRCARCVAVVISPAVTVASAAVPVPGRSLLS